MPFWTTINTDPKRSFRYRFLLGGTENNNTVKEYTIKDVKKPSFQMEGGPQVKYIQHTFKYPGRVMWQPVTFSVVDPGAAAEDASIALLNILERSGYRKPDQENNSRSSISKQKATVDAGIGSPRILEIDADGLETTTWTLHNTYLTNVDFGNLSYDTDELVTYQITLEYDYATISSKLGGVTVNDGVRSTT